MSPSDFRALHAGCQVVEADTIGNGLRVRVLVCMDEESCAETAKMLVLDVKRTH